MIPPANVATVERSVDFAAGKDISLFGFVHSYTVDRIQHILDSLESTPDLIPRLSGVIITPTACGHSGKCATIWCIKETLDEPTLKTILIDDNAESSAVSGCHRVSSLERMLN